MKALRRVNTAVKGDIAFSLLELVVVISILAILSSIFISLTGGDDSNENSPTGKAAYSSSRSLMVTISRAITKFRNDMGYYPNQGRLDPSPEGRTSKIDLSELKYIDANNPTTDNSSDTLKENWAKNSANLWQLFIQPVDTTDPSLWNWNKSTQRGWNGPYLKGKLRHNYKDGQTGLSRIMGIADAFDNKRSFISAGNTWFIDYESPFENPENMSGGSPDFASVTKYGKPIIFEVISILSDSDQEIGKSYQLRSLGPNGQKENPGDDIIVEIERVIF